MRFYFDVSDGRRIKLDEVGSEITSMRLLRETVVDLLTVLIEEMPHDHERTKLAVTVRDTHGCNVIAGELNLAVNWCNTTAGTEIPLAEREKGRGYDVECGFQSDRDHIS